MTYVFLDEVQLVSAFEKVLDSLYLRKNIDLYVTGSSANMLSGELVMLISGRYIGLRNLIVGRSRSDRGHVLEYIVFLELKGQGYEVSIGKVGSMEVDFVAVKANETLYIQVAASITSEETFQREVLSLKAIKDHFPKYILTLD